MKLEIKEITTKKDSLGNFGYCDFDPEVLGYEAIEINNRPGGYLTKNNKIYSKYVFTDGDYSSQSYMDEYNLSWERYFVAFLPIFKKDFIDNKETKRISEIIETCDFFRTDNCEVAKLHEIVALLEKLGEEVVVDLDYLNERNIPFRNPYEGGVWELRELSPDLVTGRMAYKFAYLTTMHGKDAKVVRWLGKTNSNTTKRMDKELFKKIAKYLETFYERSDNFDPMWDIEKGAIYTFEKDKVEEILRG